MTQGEAVQQLAAMWTARDMTGYIRRLPGCNGLQQAAVPPGLAGQAGGDLPGQPGRPAALAKAQAIPLQT